MPEESLTKLVLEPIGVVHSPFVERVDAPRQASVAERVEGRVELFGQRGFEDALIDIERWDHLWLVVWFHKNSEYRAKVQPPRSTKKHGVFATRSPHRPNPIGLSAVRLLRVEGLSLFVSGMDLLDQTPVLDIKPYVAYSDAIPDASQGFLADADPLRDYAVSYAALAREQLAFLPEPDRATLIERIEAALKLGPSPHAYRRIRKDAQGYRLAVKDWRVRFESVGRAITVIELRSGYRPRELYDAAGQAPALHRAFVAKWPAAIDP